jgi:chromosome partitioning protein
MMLTILVASSKGGCGKTTISTHLAAYFALAGKRTTLLDADPQHSALRWCERRAALDYPVTGIDAARRHWERRIPADTERLVIDAPAGAMAAQLAPLVEHADALLVPVLPSVIDLDATLPFVTGLASLPRIRRGRCAAGLVGNRLKPWTQASQTALQQMTRFPLPLVAELRDSQAYVLLAGLGKSLFDYNSETIRSHQQDWHPLFGWLRRVNKARGKTGG